ncbi:MAG: hypothetical protein ACK56I_12720, partial [bacterium]
MPEANHKPRRANNDKRRADQFHPADVGFLHECPDHLSRECLGRLLDFRQSKPARFGKIPKIVRRVQRMNFSNLRSFTSDQCRGGSSEGGFRVFRCWCRIGCSRCMDGRYQYGVG